MTVDTAVQNLKKMCEKAIDGMAPGWEPHMYVTLPPNSKGHCPKTLAGVGSPRVKLCNWQERDKRFTVMVRPVAVLKWLEKKYGC